MISFITNKLIFKKANQELGVNTPQSNPSYHFESPEEKQFASIAPVKIRDVGMGATNPKLGTFSDGSQAYLKDEPRALHLEPLMAQFAKHLGTNVPMTVSRNFNGKNYSVQKAVPGDLAYNVPHDPSNHPQFHNMALFDWLTGNTDRHGENYMVEKGPNGDTIHAIDHNFGFKFFKDHGNGQIDPLFLTGSNKEITSQHGYMNQNLKSINPDALIPPEFIKGLDGLTPDVIKELMSRYLSHPNAQGYLKKVYSSMSPEQATSLISNHMIDRANHLRNVINKSKSKTFREIVPQITAPTHKWMI